MGCSVDYNSVISRHICVFSMIPEVNRNGFSRRQHECTIYTLPVPHQDTSFGGHAVQWAVGYYTLAVFLIQNTVVSFDLIPLQPASIIRLTNLQAYPTHKSHSSRDNLERSHYSTVMS